jgi:hypothetical protein
MHVCWVLEPVRYASVCSLQSAGETQSGPPGYQTDTRHSRAGLWDTGWPTGGTGTGLCLRGTLPSHAETTEQLHTSPPGDKTVRNSRDLSWYTSLHVIEHYLTLIVYLLVQVSAEHWRGLEYSTVRYFSGATISDVCCSILSHHGTVIIMFLIIRCSLSHYVHFYNNCYYMIQLWK